MLIIVSTPIGNLSDFSLRAQEALRSCDLILCEDTRHSSTLLKHYGIEKPLLPFHQFNEKGQEEKILRQLAEGRKIALISDAGTPLISDPGHSLVQACIERGLPFTAIPGPCSPIQALLLSGFSSERFQFIGFLSRTKGELEEALRRALFYRGTTIAFESPQRLIQTLELLQQIDPYRRIAVARELTKTFEECRRGTPEELLSHFRQHEPRGEIILLISEGKPPIETTDPMELIELLQELHGLTSKEAIKAAADMLGIPKRTLYRDVHQDK